MRLKFIIFAFLITLIATPILADTGNSYDAEQNASAPIISKAALQIGTKIWNNECGGTVSGLTSWSAGENFASLGIGHFTWYPSNSNHRYADSTFPSLLKYLEEHGANPPLWLHGAMGYYCPWSNREEFLLAQRDPRMFELRVFLSKTVPLQAQYMVYRLQKAIPRMLEDVDATERATIFKEFYELMQTEAGIYALVDYLNFKGEGIVSYDHTRYFPNNTSGTWGLLQVLAYMPNAPHNLTPIESFVWSARQTLIKRVFYAPPERHDEKWLMGWLNRVNTYLR